MSKFSSHFFPDSVLCRTCAIRRCRCLEAFTIRTTRNSRNKSSIDVTCLAGPCGFWSKFSFPFRLEGSQGGRGRCLNRTWRVLYYGTGGIFCPKEKGTPHCLGSKPVHPNFPKRQVLQKIAAQKGHPPTQSPLPLPGFIASCMPPCKPQGVACRL